MVYRNHKPGVHPNTHTNTNPKLKETYNMSNTTKRETRGQFCGTATVNLNGKKEAEIMMNI